MLIQDVNPFVRYAELQPSILLGSVTRAAYDHRLFYCLSGKGSVKIRGKEQEVREDTAVFLRPGVPYKFTGNLKVMVLNFDVTRARCDVIATHKPSRIDAFDADQIIENTYIDNLDEFAVVRRAYELKEHFFRCVSAFKTNSVLKDALSSASVKAMLTTLISLLKSKNDKAGEIVGEIMMYIQANFDGEVSNERIATAFGYHSYYLNRIFKEQTGKTLHEALLLVRVENARQLLKNTDLPIKDVQVQSGFKSRSQFNVAFERRIGMTPREFKRMHRENS